MSVIIPAYNREGTIGRAIRSVLSQSFNDLELIVVDDFSTDETIAVVQGFDDRRLRYVRHERNLGAAAARNTGIRSAQGQFLAFLDSDDEWLPQKLGEQVELLNRAPKSTEGNCTGYFLHLVRWGISINKISGYPKSWLKHFLIAGCDLTPGTTFVGTSQCFKNIGFFDERLPRLEDGDWLIRYARQYDLALIQQPLARVYSHERPPGLKVEVSVNRFLEKYKGDIQGLGWYNARKAKSKLSLQVAEAYLKEGTHSKGFKWLFKALAQSPFQRPGMYLLLYDAFFGTSIAPRTSRLKRRLLGVMRSLM